MGKRNISPRLMVISTGDRPTGSVVRPVSRSRCNYVETIHGDANQHKSRPPIQGGRQLVPGSLSGNWLFFAEFHAVGRVGRNVISRLLYYPEAANDDGVPL